jgi:hypothetical protein
MKAKWIFWILIVFTISVIKAEESNEDLQKNDVVNNVQVNLFCINKSKMAKNAFLVNIYMYLKNYTVVLVYADVLGRKLLSTARIFIHLLI